MEGFWLIAKAIPVRNPPTKKPPTKNLLTLTDMNIVILSPEKQIFSGPVKSVKVPGASGSFEMLENHAPIVSSLEAGEVRIVKENGEKMSLRVEGGFVEMLNNEVSLLVAGVKE